MYKYVFFALMMLTRLPLFAEMSQGEILERQQWESIKNHKWNDLEKRVAPYFQLALFDEVLNKEHYMNHVKALNVGEFILNNFKVTEGAGTVVVTYDVAVSETIEGRPLTSRANRLSVWQKNNDNWQMIAHAILIPILPSSPSAAQPKR